MDLFESYSKRFPALHYKDFRLFWMGQFISQIGSQMQLVGINWHIYILTGSALSLGLVGLARFIPIVFFALIGGTIADHFPRRYIMIVTQTGFLLLSALLFISTITHTVSPLIIYLLSAGIAALNGFDGPARQGLIPRLIPQKDLPSAVSIGVLLSQIATIVGPAIGGLTIAKFGVEGVYLFNTLSFIGVLTGLFFMTSNGEPLHDQEFSFSGMLDGLHFILSKTMLWSTMLLDFFSTFFSSATTLLPIFAKDILHVGPQGLGLLYSAPAIGAVLTGLIIAHIHQLRRQGYLILSGVAIYAVGTIIFGFSTIFWISLLSLGLIGVGDTISMTLRNMIRQLETPDTIRGRMSAVNMIFNMGGPQIGEFEAGAVANRFGAPISVVSGGLITLGVIVLMAFGIRTLREYDTFHHKT